MLLCSFVMFFIVLVLSLIDRCAFTSYKCDAEQTSCLLCLCVTSPEIQMTPLVTFGLILMPYAVIFTFFSLHYGEIAMCFKSSFDSSGNKICTAQVRNTILCYS